MNEFDEFIELTEHCAEQCEVMILCEKEKRQALLSVDTDHMESVMQNQQAAIMRLDSMEKKRLESQLKIGFGTMTANEILEHTSGHDRERLSACFERLRTAAKELKFHNAKALEIAKESLQFIESAKPVAQKRADGPVTYRPGQVNGNWNGNSSFEIKI